LKSVTVRCPECNAVLEAGAETREVRCSYCNTLVVVQRRTGFLKRLEPLPPRPADAPPVRVATAARPAALLVGSLLSIAVMALLVVIPILLFNRCNLAGIAPSSVIVASTWGVIAAYDLASGEELYTID
jgi:DNA-directed RNA polymerase subunit RPC12/RpoP